MSKFERSICLLLAMIILVGVFSPAAQAAPAEETASVNTDNVTIEGTNGFGNLLSQEIAENQEEAEAADAEYPGGYTVTDLVIEGNTATVTYDTMEEAALVVALYTEDGMQLVTSTTAKVAPDVTEAKLTFEDDMPEYFMASAYLLDCYDFSPLCAAYDTPMYTQEMQELLASTVNDYDPEKVLNLDEDDTTNFAVYADSTIVIEPVEGKNTVASIDDENTIYVIKNTNEQITSLNEGDVFAYSYGENELLIGKVKTISVTGTTATITGAELAMEDAFSHVKIEANSDTSEAEVDTSVAHEGITYVGNSHNSYISTMDEGGTAFDKELKFTLDMTILGDDTTSINLSGNLNFAASVEITYYITSSYQQIELRLGSKIGGNLAVSEKLGGTFSLAKLKFPIIVGMLEVGLEPGIVVEFEGELAVEYAHSATHLLMVSHGSDGFYSDYRYVSEEPHIAAELEGRVFIGLSLAPLIDIASGMLVTLKVELQAGFEATLSMRSDEASKGIKHTCKECLSGEIAFIAKVIPSLMLLNWERLEFSATFSKAQKLCDIYYSFDNADLGIGSCPNKEYRVVVHAKEESGFSASGVEVSGQGTVWGVTDQNGTLETYVPSGYYLISAKKNTRTTSADIYISEPSKITITLGKGASVNTNPGEGLDMSEYLKSVSKEDIVDFDTIVASGLCGDNVKWMLHESGLMVISGFGVMTDYSSFGGAPWDGIRSSVKAVHIENGVLSIGSYAFADCNSMTSVTIPDSVISIGNGAFFFCESLSSVIIPESVTSIGVSAFRECRSLTSVTIPSGVMSIGSGAFSYCNNLTEIYVDRDNPNFYSSQEGVLFNKTQTELIQAPGAISGMYFIPDGVASIESGAFGRCEKLTRVAFPNSVIQIGEYAFFACDSLTTVTIGNGVTSIGDDAFYACKNLIDVTISDSVTNIGNSVFSQCDNLSNVTIGSGVRSIGGSVFMDCSSLSNVIIPASVTLIGAYAFDNCRSLSSVTFIGDKPDIRINVFRNVSATAYYPANNTTWTASGKQNYGGTITWVPYTPSEGNSIIGELTEISAQKPAMELEAVYGGEYSTEITKETTIKTASFSNLVPGEQYVMLAMVSVEEDNPLDAENLLGIAQGAADENGTLHFRYIQRTPYDISYVVVCGASSKNLNDAEIAFPDMVADGELQVVDPVVVYDGVTLTEGQDYVIAGKVDFTEAGEYTCYIRGIHNYAGLVECTYTVAEHEHSFTNYVSDGNATCTEDGTKTARCDHCDATDTIPDAGSALGHDMGSWETTVPVTCTENGEEQRTCSRCDHSESRVIEAVGHRWDNGVVTREPTEDTEGERLYTCTACGATRTESIPVIGHEHRYETVVTAPTCTERGYTTYTCKCGESYVADYVAALGHSFGDWAVIQEPTTTEDGLEERSCSRCGHTEQRTIAKLENPFNDVAPGSFYYEPVMWAVENGITNGTSATTFGPNDQCMRAHVVTFLWRAVGSPEPTRTDNPFVDVKPTDFYYKPVLWAVENGITSGMDANHFGPTAYCNRAQVVTFLYRTMGNPDVGAATNPFTDVAAGSFYEKPVLWAVENGVTAGLSATSFGPNSICNRAQIVTFLYRAFVD